MSEAELRAREVRPWIEKAENDLLNAEHTLTLERHCPYDTVCFHAQQCAEKYLKGLLVSLGVRFRRTHDLGFLIGLVRMRTSLKISTQAVLMLNRYAVEARYPGPWEPYTDDEARAALANARLVRRVIRDQLSFLN